MTEKLKNCPFCGNDIKEDPYDFQPKGGYWDGDNNWTPYYIRCNNCNYEVKDDVSVKKIYHIGGVSRISEDDQRIIDEKVNEFMERLDKTLQGTWLKLKPSRRMMHRLKGKKKRRRIRKWCETAQQAITEALKGTNK